MIAIKTFGDYCEEHPSRMADVYIQGFRYAGHEELANRVERASGLLALWALHKDVADLIEDPGAASMCGLIVDGVATARFFQIPIPETWKGPLFACDMVVQGSRIYKQLTTKKIMGICAGCTNHSGNRDRIPRVTRNPCDAICSIHSDPTLLHACLFY